MWKVLFSDLTWQYFIAYMPNNSGVNDVKIHTIDGAMYRTPYQSEAQELADKLNGDSDE